MVDSYQAKDISFSFDNKSHVKPYYLYKELNKERVPLRYSGRKRSTQIQI